MKRQIPKVYADTSVFGGVFDEEFRRPSRCFFDLVRQGRISLVLSEVVQRELRHAPETVRELWHEMLPVAETASVTEDAVDLQGAYLEARILSPRSAEDALHVALATVYGCRAIVSWNFRHIVHFEKIVLYNAVNVLHGFGNIAIHSPSEVVGYGPEQEEV